MTKKDYELLAKVLNKASKRDNIFKSMGLFHFKNMLLVELYESNKRFNVDSFEKVLYTTEEPTK